VLGWPDDGTRVAEGQIRYLDARLQLQQPQGQMRSAALHASRCWRKIVTEQAFGVELRRSLWALLQLGVGRLDRAWALIVR
jgi:hypothetical protein